MAADRGGAATMTIGVHPVVSAVTVSDGGSAALTGQISVGDMVHSINGVDVRNMPVADVVPILGQREFVVLSVSIGAPRG